MSAKNFNDKAALLLAGKVASQAKRVINSSAITVSGECSALRIALREYDEYIMEWASSKNSSSPTEGQCQ